LTLPATNPGGDPEESGSYPRKSQDIAEPSQKRPVADHGMLVELGEDLLKLKHRTRTYLPTESKSHAVYQKAI
jgi:hypothetical protein